MARPRCSAASSTGVARCVLPHTTSCPLIAFEIDDLKLSGGLRQRASPMAVLCCQNPPVTAQSAVQHRNHKVQLAEMALSLYPPDHVSEPGYTVHHL